MVDLYWANRKGKDVTFASPEGNIYTQQAVNKIIKQLRTSYINQIHKIISDEATLENSQALMNILNKLHTLQ